MFTLRSFSFSCTLLLSQVLILCDRAGGQIINGDFSQPGISANGSCQAGTGWTTASGTKSCQYTNLLGPGTNFWIDITPCWSSGNGSYIEQKVPTIPGNCYYLKFDLGAYCKWNMSDAGVYIKIDGNPLGQRIFNDSIDCSDQYLMNWTTRTSPTFIATGTTTTIRFTGEGRCTKHSLATGYNCTTVGSITSPGVMGIDNIVLVSTTLITGNASIDTGYYCGGGTIPVKALGVSSSATIQWSVLSGAATINGSGDSVNVTAKENAQVLMTVTEPGICGAKSDTVTIIVPTLEATMDIIDKRICREDTVFFIGSFSGNVDPTSVKTLWYFGDGTTSSNLIDRHSYKNPGPYTVLFVVNETSPCALADTLEKEIKDIILLQPYIDVGPRDTMVCSDVTVALPLGISARGGSYLWSDGSTQPRLYANAPGTYIVTLSNDCGSATDTITIGHIGCSVWFPGAFSPNGDNKNDMARLIGPVGDVTDFELLVYNRYGNQVFTTNDVYEGWDGTYKGKPQPIGVYYYYLRYTLNAEKRTLKGDITLVR